jgi:micrococcal nuclease
LLAVTAAVVLAACANDESARDVVTIPISRRATTTTAATIPVASSETSTAGATQEWQVVSVGDGDSVVLRGPDGESSIRLIGVQTPEVGECYYQEAWNTLMYIVAKGIARVERDVSDEDQFGRKLRYVFDAVGSDVGADLVRLGAATSSRNPPDTARNDVYDRLEDQARAMGRGRWAAGVCATGQPSPIGVEQINADPPGDDIASLNDEWVRLVNISSASVDLAGWTVADNGMNRYAFKAFVLAPGAAVTLHTGCGQDSDADRFWCEDRPVWNNGGDTVRIRDSAGKAVTQRRYP